MELVARPVARTPHPTRAGGQDDGSHTNSLKPNIIQIALVPATGKVAREGGGGEMAILDLLVKEFPHPFAKLGVTVKPIVCHI